MKKVYIETLGCARNKADSEILSGLMGESDYEITDNPQEARFIIINTCGFIEDAINESIETIMELSEYKKKGNCRFLIVAGCFAQRFKEELSKELTEADYIVGTGGFFDLPGIIKDLDEKEDVERTFFPDPLDAMLHMHDTPKVISSYPHAFLKIAEGCARKCTYCIIPDLKGPLRSRGPEDIIKEAKKLVKAGIKEIVVVSQESTDYGRDLSTGEDIAYILDNVAAISDDVWVRFMYGHPLSIDDRLIDVVASRENICSYFDVPMQHASDSILKKMGRGYKASSARDLFLKIRERVENAVLRTTLITGFPGETDDDFKRLVDFMEEIKFDHAGVFTYSEMDDIYSSRFENKVDFETAQERQVFLMERQALISQEINSKYLDQVLPVLIDKKDTNEFYAGRTMFQAPEVDGITYVDAENLKPGDIVKVRITDSFDYDLAGNVE